MTSASALTWVVGGAAAWARNLRQAAVQLVAGLREGRRARLELIHSVRPR